MKTIISAGFILITMLAPLAWGDLTGRWSCNDGGTYYLRQAGSQVHWYGEAAEAQPAWSTVFSGRIHQGRIKGNWADVPKGSTAGSGDLELVIEKDGNTLRAVNKTGGLSGSRWMRVGTDAAGTRPMKPLKPPKNEDCVRFNLATVRVRQVNARWKIVDGDHWLFDFGSNRAAADRALKVIRYYRMDRYCCVGLPDPSFSYMLAKGGSPSGAMAGEDCMALDPKTITLSKIQGSWKIVAGRHWLFDFGQSQTDAHKALAAIRRYGFTRSCVVGRPDADFTYLRR